MNKKRKEIIPDMKKFLSAIFTFALVLALSLSLCSFDYAEKGESESSSMNDERFSPPTIESDIIDIINQHFKHGYNYTVSLEGDRPDTLFGLYVSTYGTYIAYVVVYDGDAVEAEALVEIEHSGNVTNEYFITGYTSSRTRGAVRQAANYVATHYMEDYIIDELVRNMFLETYGECSRSESFLPRENGVHSVTYSPENNSYVAYIDTFEPDSYNFGIRALVAINQDDHVVAVRPIGHSFKDSIDYYPTDAEIDEFFYQYVSLSRDEIDSAEYIPECYGVCSDFSKALHEAFKSIDEMKPSWFETLVTEIFGSGADPFFVVLGLAVVAIVALLVIGALVIVPIAILVIIIVVIIIIVVASKKKKKKKLAAAQKAKPASAPKTAAAEAAPETDNAQGSEDKA